MSQRPSGFVKSKRTKIEAAGDEIRARCRLFLKRPSYELQYDAICRLGRRMGPSPAAGIGYVHGGLSYRAFSDFTSLFNHTRRNNDRVACEWRKHSRAGKTTTTFAPIRDGIPISRVPKCPFPLVHRQWSCQGPPMRGPCDRVPYLV